MPIKVNLIKNRHTLSEAEYQKERLYYRYATTGLLIIAVVTVAIALWQFVLTRQMSTIASTISEATGQLQNLATANAKQIYLKSRLKLIMQFLDERTVARQAIQKVFSLTIPGVTVSSVTFDETNLMRVQFTAQDTFAFGDLMSYLTTKDDFFLQAVARGVNRSEDGKYQMVVLLTLPNS